MIFYNIYFCSYHIFVHHLTQIIIIITIFQNEAERKSRHGDHIELNKTNELSAERSRKGIDSFLESYRSNKQQIERALDNRPTLLQRHQEVCIE